MAEIHNIREFKQQSNAGKVSIVALLFLPLIGLLCLFWPEEIADVLPYILGFFMMVSGTGSIVVAIREGSVDAADKSVGASIVLMVLGAVSLASGTHAIAFIGVMWGLLGLYKSAEEFNTVLRRVKMRKPCLLTLAFAIFELVLAVLLITSPFANIDHHVILLGVELIAYPFKIDRSEDGTIKLEADA